MLTTCVGRGLGPGPEPLQTRRHRPPSLVRPAGSHLPVHVCPKRPGALSATPFLLPPEARQLFKVELALGPTSITTSESPHQGPLASLQNEAPIPPPPGEVVWGSLPAPHCLQAQRSFRSYRPAPDPGAPAGWGLPSRSGQGGGSFVLPSSGPSRQGQGSGGGRRRSFQRTRREHRSPGAARDLTPVLVSKATSAGLGGSRQGWGWGEQLGRQVPLPVFIWGIALGDRRPGRRGRRQDRFCLSFGGAPWGQRCHPRQVWVQGGAWAAGSPVCREGGSEAGTRQGQRPDSGSQPLPQKARAQRAVLCALSPSTQGQSLRLSPFPGELGPRGTRGTQRSGTQARLWGRQLQLWFPQGCGLPPTLFMTNKRDCKPRMCTKCTL